MDESAILDALGELVIVRGADRRIVYVNAAMLRAFGGRREDWVGRALGSIMFEDTASPGQGGRWRATGPLRTIHGAMDVEWEETPLPDGGSVAVGRDITARLATETALRKDRAGVEQEARQRDALFAMITHELRTPAAGIAGLADVLADTRLTPAQASYVNALRVGGRHLLKLVDDTLDLARLEAGAFDLSPEPTNIADLLSEAADWLQPEARRKGLTLAVWIDPSTPRRVAADAGRLRQIILNLAGNAIKFTEHGGVMMGVERDGAGAAGQTRLRVVVEDTGPGIPPAQKERVFEAFARLEHPGAAKEGAGLGLAITRRLAAAMDGEVGFESEPGAGSVFWAQLSLDVEDPAPLGDARQLAGREVAVASPDPLLRRALTRMIAGLGADVVGVANTEEARQAATERLILTDIQWAETIRPGALGGIVLAHDTTDTQAWRRAGYDDVLATPLRFGALVHAFNAIQPPAPAPRATPQSFAPQNGDGPGPTITRSASVLVVEDDEVNRFLARAVLGRLGADVTEASTGQEALDAAALRPFDLVLMDMRLPGINGVEVVRRLRRTPAYARTPIIAVTANASPTEGQACLDAGMNEVIVKPVSEAALRAVFEQWAPNVVLQTHARAATPERRA